MMTASEILDQTWLAVTAEAPQADGFYHRRIPLAARWPAHAGIHRPTNLRILILETESVLVRDNRLKERAKGFSVDIGPDEAGRADRAIICIQETNQSYREIFTLLCADILDCWTPHTDAAEALKSLRRRLASWKKFFQRGPQLGLSREEHIGLYGELSFVEAGLDAGMDGLSLINGWTAPLGTNQDFLFGPTAVEIKATTGNDFDKVRITNVRQLDSTGLQNLFLVCYAFDFRQACGNILRQLVENLKARLSVVSPEALIVFTDRLLEAGFVDSIPNEFDDWGFSLRRNDVFRVGEGFPRLLETGVPPGLSEITYTLNLSAAASFKVLKPTFWTSVRSSYE